jgi:hypothetical protein
LGLAKSVGDGILQRFGGLLEHRIDPLKIDHSAVTPPSR